MTWPGAEHLFASDEAGESGGLPVRVQCRIGGQRQSCDEIESKKPAFRCRHRDLGLADLAPRAVPPAFLQDPAAIHA